MVYYVVRNQGFGARDMLVIHYQPEPDEDVIPFASYEAAAERVAMFLNRARAHLKAGRRAKAVADINAAADIEVEAARAKRLLLPAPALAV